ncbi:peptide-methionine (S)-S-oxide reductase MsrA [Pararhizobium antarcticum]|uniref:Peptide methionine sulfoxide reductase MsrA n=1 Tax=Pararhizobium antarcticum TaxID=1798805 RepID=A0A657LN51_9HYPH|nr:peptide-methionine (S)-S-oxide reductase MsrA [Pararhizobium antarcticum]OJF91875.1 peptide methionine sulfoxide reductase [Pararhizobium antarcticum]OJF97953.1 peptide methionine sulfoxide reductase [Rhizobium sp. 58]
MLRTVLVLGFLGLGAVAGRAAEPQVAIFAGGCFWCVESDFDKVPGVLETTSGYAGGTSKNPAYKTYIAGGHREVVEIKFDPDKVSYETLSDILFRTTDPTDGGGQFCDRGFAYSTAIYALSPEQASQAEASKARAQAELGKPIVTPIEPAAKFWPAEDYHQNFATRSSIRYWYYRNACGRNDAVEALWGIKAYAGVVD